jgi:signal transduction histidine kinase
MVDLNAVISRFIADRMLLAEGKGLDLSCQISPLPTIQADEGMLEQVLSVILTNAINYTPSGGSVTVSSQLLASNGQPWAGFKVTDTGPGISPEEQKHLFERFFRGKVGKVSQAPGTGLGLAIAKEIVERHYGRLEVESAGVPGLGTSFSVWLPISSDLPPANEAKSPLEVSTRTG